MKVAIFFGSRSDTDKMKGAARCLEEFGIEYEAHILSAHRVPEKLEQVIKQCEDSGTECFIAGAGRHRFEDRTAGYRHSTESGFRGDGFTFVDCSDA